MAHSLSAQKRVRQNAAAKARNRWRLSTLRDSLKSFEDKFRHGDAVGAKTAFATACQLLDKTASKGVIHKNTAARKKSRLSARLKSMGKFPALATPKRAQNTTKPTKTSKETRIIERAADAEESTAESVFLSKAGLKMSRESDSMPKEPIDNPANRPQDIAGRVPLGPTSRGERVELLRDPDTKEEWMPLSSSWRGQSLSWGASDQGLVLAELHLPSSGALTTLSASSGSRFVRRAVFAPSLSCQQECDAPEFLIVVEVRWDRAVDEGAIIIGRWIHQQATKRLWKASVEYLKDFELLSKTADPRLSWRAHSHRFAAEGENRLAEVPTDSVPAGALELPRIIYMAVEATDGDRYASAGCFYDLRPYHGGRMQFEAHMPLAMATKGTGPLATLIAQTWVGSPTSGTDRDPDLVNLLDEFVVRSKSDLWAS